MTEGASARPHHDDPGRHLGPAGLEPVAGWYEERGYEVLERHWHRREGEVDLIVRRAATVVFTELTTHPLDPVDGAAEPVLPARQRRIHRLASRWLSELTPAVGRARIELRFDVASVVAGSVQVIEDAF